MKWIRFAVAAVFAVAMSAAASAGYLPRRAPEKPVEVPLRILPGKNMPLARVTVGGCECDMLVDTGATHTTLDMAFAKKALPGETFRRAVLGGTTNVEGAPSVVGVVQMNVGEAEFGDFDAMALDLSGLKPVMGRDFGGILGMNVLGRVPALFSLGSASLVFCPDDAARDGFSSPAPRKKVDPFSVAFDATLGGRTFEVIVDSGATFTFLDATLGWPSSGEHVAFGAHDVNGGASSELEKGKKGTLALGAPLEIEPLLAKGPMNRIGADTLLAYDMLIDFAKVYFRPCVRRSPSRQRAE